MNDLWIEEELFPDDQMVAQAAKSLPSEEAQDQQQVKSQLRGIVRISRPRWRLLTQEEASGLLRSGRAPVFYLVRLGFQFDLSPEARDHGNRFVEARCSARLYPAQLDQPQPTVCEVIPRYYFEGKPSTMSIKFSPKIKLGVMEAGVGEAGMEISVGYVEPSITGWSGQDDCEPYWELRPKSQELKGERHVWLIAEVPSGAEGLQLALKAEGALRSHLFGLIPIGPRLNAWSQRSNIMII